jgi:hypothetical protein
MIELFTVCDEESAACAQRLVQQVIGREGETATLLSRCLFNSKLREFGFAPRQFQR